MAIKFAKTRRSALAIASGAALLLGAAACSEAEDAANNATDAAGSAANSATEAAGSALNDATSSNEAEGSEGAEASDAEGAEGSDAQGSEAEGSEGNGELPADIQTLWDNEGGEAGALGALQNVEETDKGTLATFDNGWVVNSEEHGAVKLVGKIGETWANGGAMDNEIGLPTAPEQGDAAQGWTQSFENGTIKWAKGDNGEYTDTIETN